MQLSPRLNQPTLPPWHLSLHQFNRIDAKDCHAFLMVSMEVRDVVLRANLPIILIIMP
jgi:hypothetical protein